MKLGFIKSIVIAIALAMVVPQSHAFDFGGFFGGVTKHFGGVSRMFNKAKSFVGSNQGTIMKVAGSIGLGGLAAGVFGNREQIKEGAQQGYGQARGYAQRAGSYAQRQFGRAKQFASNQYNRLRGRPQQPQQEFAEAPAENFGGGGEVDEYGNQISGGEFEGAPGGFEGESVGEFEGAPGGFEGESVGEFGGEFG